MTRSSSQQVLGGVLAILVAAMLWGTTGTAATFAPEVGPLAIGAVAMGIGGLLQALMAWRSIWRSRTTLRAHVRHILWGGIMVAIYPLAFYSSMRLAGVAIGTVITIGSAPLLSALIEWRLEGLRLTPRWFAGTFLGLLGTVLLCLADPHSGAVAQGSSHILTGVAVALMAGLSYAAYSWSARRLMQSGIRSSAAMGATFGLGGTLLMPVLLVTGAPLVATWNNLGVGVYMAIVPMFMGYICFGLGLARVRASVATTITLVEPVVAAVLAVLIVGENLTRIGWTGVTLIVASLFCITAPLPHSKARCRLQAAR